MPGNSVQNCIFGILYRFAFISGILYRFAIFPKKKSAESDSQGARARAGPPDK